MPGTAVSLDASQAEKDFATAYAQVRGINASIAECSKRHDVACLEALRPLLKSWMLKMDDASRRIDANALSQTDKAILALDRAIDEAKQAGGDLAKDVGKGVLKAALPFLAVGFLLLYLKGKLL